MWNKSYSSFGRSSTVPSLVPIITLPKMSNVAPAHHSNGRLSPKMSAPRSAVIMKLAAVLITLTLTADGESDKARVNSAHIVLLRKKYSTKTN